MNKWLWKRGLHIFKTVALAALECLIAAKVYWIPTIPIILNIKSWNMSFLSFQIERMLFLLYTEKVKREIPDTNNLINQPFNVYYFMLEYGGFKEK